MGKFEIKVYDEIFNIRSITKLYKDIIKGYHEMLSMTSEILNGKYSHPSYLKNTYRKIRKDILNAYEKEYPTLKKEFENFIEFLQQRLSNTAKYGMIDIEYRIKDPYSLLEKMFRYSVKIEPGKAPIISDLLGVRIKVDKENASDIIRDNIQKVVMKSHNLTFFIETNILEERKSDKIKDPEVLLEYQDNILKWQGLVIEYLGIDIPRKMNHINIISGVPGSVYKMLRNRIKRIAYRDKSERIRLCKFKIRDETLKDKFTSGRIYLKYDHERGTLFILIPTKKIIEKEVYEDYKILYNILCKGEDLRIYDVMKRKKIFRPHYAVEKIEIPLLFNQLGINLHEFLPWERANPPKEIIITGNESYFYSGKIAYFNKKKAEAIPFLEIQILDRRQGLIFDKGEKYNHLAYKQKEKRNTIKAIDNMVKCSEIPPRGKDSVKKILKSIYKEFCNPQPA